MRTMILMVSMMAASVLSAWDVEKSEDLMSGERRVTIGVPNEDGDESLFGFSCRKGDVVAIAVFKYIGTDGYTMKVGYRIDRQQAVPLGKGGSENSWILNDKSVVLMDADWLADKLLDSERLVLQVKKYNGSLLTSSYAVSGLREAIAELPCWDR